MSKLNAPQVPLPLVVEENVYLEAGKEVMGTLLMVLLMPHFQAILIPQVGKEIVVLDLFVFTLYAARLVVRQHSPTPPIVCNIT